MIHRTAQEAVANQRREQQIDNDMQEVKTIVNTLAAAEVESEQAQAQDREQVPRAPRTLLLPQEMPVDQRPHYMQPRSVRSVDSLLHRQKRVKRCSCDCR
ncbi:jg25329 [Pararge aegeria aegeria]|uniref:Jg25329 protein n=2 Tax=Pararge aegeria TaxID=116150 RepID=A0A8S4RYX9_9NEOP|nr:jg25329 [Pararge aegeria aegeria]